MACEMCEAIKQNKRGVEGHKYLESKGSKKADVVGQNIYFSFYRCSQCGQSWRYENDKNDLNAGWSKQSI